MEKFLFSKVQCIFIKYIIVYILSWSIKKHMNYKIKMYNKYSIYLQVVKLARVGLDKTNHCAECHSFNLKWLGGLLFPLKIKAQNKLIAISMDHKICTWTVICCIQA